METATVAIIIAAATLIFNIGIHVFGGGFSLSTRLSKIESAVDGMQTEIRKLADVLVKLADMRGDLRVLDGRVAAAEQDIRELRHGDGFIRGRRSGIDGEYP